MAKSLKINMPKARAIHMARIREARNATLAATDAEMMRLNESGTQAQINKLKADRQALRDLPSTLQASIDAATTPSQLSAIWPEATIGKKKLK